MTLGTGTKLSHYEVLGPLGAGAMGEVYRAKDSKLGREVAIKVLPEHFAADEERLRRFEREAKTLATVNHPNVAQIHGVDQVGDTCFLVLELVEGESLEERLKRGPLPLAEALDVCRQIAEGLEAAHEAGVIHRDLKPANIRLTPDGRVKVLDFGLAKPASESHHGSSTDSVLSTETGRLLGTPTYMAPEQARGKPIDKRVDIWAFGCVLYECLTARRAFAGETLTDVFAAVIEREADLSKLPAATPQRVRELLQRCLSKDGKQRLQSIGEARIVLAHPHDGLSEGRVFATRRPVWPWTIAAIALAGWIVTTVFLIQRTPSGVVDMRTSLALPDEVGIPVGLVPDASMATLAISPTGDQVAYVGFRMDEGPSVYVRHLDSFDSVRLTSDTDAIAPFFAPDGKRLAFFSGTRIWRIDLPGGVPVALGPAMTTSLGGTWTDADAIVYVPGFADPLWTVSAGGGEPRQLTTVDRAAGEVSHRWPCALPGTAGVLFSIKSETDESLDDARIAVTDPGTGKHRVLLEGGSMPRYLDSGQLVFARAGRLYAVGFDLSSRTIHGAPISVLEGVATQPMNGAAWYDVTRQGCLVFAAGGRAENHVQFAWEGPGRTTEPLKAFDGGFGGGVWLSRDFKRAVACHLGANDKLWLVDLEQMNTTPLTSGGGNDINGVLSHDGRWLIFSSDRAGAGHRFYRAPLDGSAQPALLLEGLGYVYSLSYPANMLGLDMLRPGADDLDAYVIAVAADGTPAGKPILVAGGPNYQSSATVSPDGTLVAYRSNESGRSEIYVARLADPGSRRRLTTDGGGVPLWNRDGSRLFYQCRQGVVATALVSAAELRFDATQVIAPERDSGDILGWDIAADGSSALVMRVTNPFDLRRDLRFWPNWGATLRTGR